MLFPLVFFGVALVARTLSALGLSNPQSPLRSVLSVQSWWDAPLAILQVAVVAVTEETVFRGYLLLRFRAVSGSTSVALIRSTLVFAMGHEYEGQVGLVMVALIGLAIAVIYVHTGSLVAPIVLHSLQDFISIVVLPALFHSGTIGMLGWKVLAMTRSNTDSLVRSSNRAIPHPMQFGRLSAGRLQHLVRRDDDPSLPRGTNMFRPIGVMGLC